MARGRFLLPQDGVIIIENLQIPGRRVMLSRDQSIEAFFQHGGQIYQFRSRVIEMDTPVRLNDTMLVRGMKIAAPVKIEKGNRRTIYRQSFATVSPAVACSIWPVPLSVLTPDQMACLTPRDADENHGIVPGSGPAGDAIEGFRIERGVRVHQGPTPSEISLESVYGLTLDQCRPLLRTNPAWTGEVADASEFGLGITVRDIVYSRLKVFQPLLVRFRLPAHSQDMAFVIEIRRVQRLGEDSARLGGLLLINAMSQDEVRASRALAKFSLELQRERAKRVREAG
jgi:c-di-GMP-binding flagellar brake protein YcgR